MVSFSPCKINLGLYITGKRSDGYHELVTCFYPIPWYDVLEIVPAKTFGFSLTGLPIPGAPGDNLCVRAYEMVKNEYPLEPVSIHLHKILPVGAGLGAGSSDGTYALKTLNQLFDLGFDLEMLKAFAARLGSDCAFFVEDKPKIGTGRGEVLSDVALNLKGWHAAIIKPELQISSSEAYGKIKPARPAVGLREILEKHAVSEWRELLKNDFSEVLFKEFPMLYDIEQRLYGLGAAYASMSGSGSAIFGLFKDEVKLKNDFKSMVCWSGRLN